MGDAKRYEAVYGVDNGRGWVRLCRDAADREDQYARLRLYGGNRIIGRTRRSVTVAMLRAVLATRYPSVLWPTILTSPKDAYDVADAWQVAEDVELCIYVCDYAGAALVCEDTYAPDGDWELDGKLPALSDVAEALTD